MKAKINKTLRYVRTTKSGRFLNIPRRLWIASRYYLPKLKQILLWTISSREDTNFTYDLTSRNIAYLAHTLSVVFGCSVEAVQQYLEEANQDDSVHGLIEARISSSPFRHFSDDTCWFGRRIGWYALVRMMKPKVVVETGVDKGHGAVLICAALIRNSQEGFPGRYYGTDINPNAGFLFAEPYSNFGKIIYGDSVESLRSLTESVDLFINDSDHSSDYERTEYEVIGPKLSPNAIILGDNSHCNQVLADFSKVHGRRFLFFREEPLNHWYPGAGIGISFVNSAPPPGTGPKAHSSRS